MFFDWKELEGAPFLWPLRPTYHPLIVLRPRTWLLRSASSAPRDASMALDELVELVDGVALAAAL